MHIEPVKVGPEAVKMHLGFVKGSPEAEKDSS